MIPIEESFSELRRQTDEQHGEVKSRQEREQHLATRQNMSTRTRSSLRDSALRGNLGIFNQQRRRRRTNDVVTIKNERLKQSTARLNCCQDDSIQPPTHSEDITASALISPCEMCNFQEKTTDSPDVDTELLRPRTLPLDPRQWTRNDVAEWLQVIHRQLDVDVSRFPMNGRGLCIMTPDMFHERVGPRNGSTLFQDYRRRLLAALITQSTAS